MTTSTPLMQMSVNEVIRNHPATAAVFNRHGIDACCGGAAAVARAAAAHGADPAVLSEELVKAIADGA